ncbi:MAG: DNA integrity scanning protein DisA nucleotide-binding domain protein [Elusimicrobia bacterium]|nr:DNA integrity scanning protein DisA nucleotide-binding domain protein [Elusimicrobiota bacterium]
MGAELIQLAKDIGVSGLLDIAIMSALIYAIIIWFKRSKAFFVLIGIFIIGIVYIVARELNLQLVAVVFQGFFAVILIAVIVIFQEEIKSLFERLAVWSLNPRRLRQRRVISMREEVDVLVRTLNDLAASRIGALVVLQSKDALARHINGGVELNGAVSESLLKSIFNPSSVAHDGAVVVDGFRVVRFGCHLPLSKDLKKIKNGGGTRHAAALGLSELTDALCLVASEERGTVSVARNGEIEIVRDAEQLARILESFYRETEPEPSPHRWRALFTRNIREKALSVAVTAALWFFFVHEGRPTYEAFEVPVEYTNLPPRLAVVDLRPDLVEITFSGPRRDFYLIRPTRFRVVLNMSDAKEGYQAKAIQRSNVSYPEKLRLETINPTHVRVIVAQQNELKR